ncbi:MAG: hypothetical protein ACREFQ_11490, partial [Stellaceae bacterium]
MRLGQRGGEEHVLDAETGIDGGEPLVEEAQEMERLAARPRRADPCHSRRAVNAVERELETARARAVPCKSAAERLEHGGGRDADRRSSGDRFGKAAAHPVQRRRWQRRERLGPRAQRLVEAGRHIPTEAQHQCGARHRIKIADPAQSHPDELRHRLGRQTQGGNRQIGECCALPAFRHYAPARSTKARDRRRGAQVIGDGGTNRDPLRFEPRHRLLEKPILAAME